MRVHGPVDDREPHRADRYDGEHPRAPPFQELPVIPRPVRRSLVSAALVGTLLATVACAGDDGGGDDRSPDGRDAGPTGGIEEIAGDFSDPRLPEPLTEVEIGLPEPKDGESEATAKVQVLSLDRDGDTVRLVGSWLRPTAGPSLGSHELTGGLQLLPQETVDPAHR